MAGVESASPMEGVERACLFCQIGRSSTTTTTLLHNDNSVVAFQDIKPAAFRHYLVIPVKHISTVKNLERRTEDFELVSHMLNVGKGLLQRDAPESKEYRFGFHQPPFNSVDHLHLHLHCLALPFIPIWKLAKYMSLGPLGGFIEAEKMLEKIRPNNSQLLVKAPMAVVERACVFCQIARSPTTTTLLHSDNSVVAFQDIKPAAFRHYLVIPVKHVSTVKNLERRTEDFELVNHMLNVGKGLLQRDAPESEEYRFGFHPPPFNSVDHLHLHCLALPFIPKWKHIKYMPLGPRGGFIEADKLLEKIRP